MTRRCEVLWFRVPRKTWERAVRYVMSAHPRFARAWTRRRVATIEHAADSNRWVWMLLDRDNYLS